MYSSFYIRNPEYNFVAVDSADKPVGYIFCASNYDLYKKSFYENELKSIRKLGILKCFSAKSEVLSMKKWAADYPAHLHIDILPDYQHRGIGKKLVQTLFEHLKQNSVNGVMLTVSASNKRAISFYEKCGFRQLSQGAGVVFAMRIC